MHTGRHSDATGRLLLIDRDVAGARLVADSLSTVLAGAPEIGVVETGRQAVDALRQARFDIVLLDLSSLGDLSERSEDAVTRLVKLAEGSLVIAISDGSSVSAAVAAMRAGAHDYVVKPISGPAIAARIDELALRHGKARTLGIEARDSVGVADCGGFIGTSSAMQFVYEQVARIAPSAAPVFIT
ncbi:MAG TPA: response regulator, partial [Devosia sp.]|nr:response regulator [Devosia sp.]